MRILESAAQLAIDFDLWLSDIWGVVHNGVRAYPEAVAALQSYRRQGGHVVLITNAPRPRGSVVEQLTRLHVPTDAYDAIVTSGDVTRSLVAGLGDKAVFQLGPEKDLGIYSGAGVRLGGAREAEAVICTGLLDDATETPETYRELLIDFAGRRLPMICANPDLVVEYGDRILYCAGSLAKLYEELGGEVVYAGKPHRPIYELAVGEAARRTGKAPDKHRILAIGDGVRTDIAGAHGFGIPSVFIPSAVDAGPGRTLDPTMLDDLFAGLPHRPSWALPRLQW
ncbi:MAG: TIGR01459 family HAD-type hydrolase [Hyphomicrobiaceae bacterium]